MISSLRIRPGEAICAPPKRRPTPRARHSPLGRLPAGKHAVPATFCDHAQQIELGSAVHTAILNIEHRIREPIGASRSRATPGVSRKTLARRLWQGDELLQLGVRAYLEAPPERGLSPVRLTATQIRWAWVCPTRVGMKHSAYFRAVSF